MARNKVIAAWSKCKVEFGDTGENDAFASILTDVGIIKDKTTELSAEDGDTLQLIATGGEVVAEDQNEGTLQLQTTVIEPSAALYTALGIADAEADGEQKVKTHIVPGDKSVKVTPKNKGAKGIKAPLCRISVQPIYDEEQGNALLLTFKIFKTTGIPETPARENNPAVDNNYWYSRFTTTESLD